MRVLVVDDEKNIRESIKRYLELENIESVGAENGISAQRLLEEEVFSAGIIDLKMPGMNGLELLSWINDYGPRLPVIMISAYGEINDAVTAMKLGAQDYIVKPFDPEELVLRLKKLIEEQKLRDKVELGKLSPANSGEFVSNTRKMADIKRIAVKLAATPSTLLITGESGTGKEVLARYIHGLSPRRDGPFIAVNIGGIPETLLESELFGYEKGAFTGAAARKNGIFELSREGTLFLDEIGDMPLHLQVKLLRVLQEKRIQRLGSTQSIPVNARIISATNRNLDLKVSRGEFREDLFYRLNVVRIEMPPLRERKEDIPLIVGQLLKKLKLKIGREVKEISPEALQGLQAYDFPGNIRELENIIERAFIFAEGDTIKHSDLQIPALLSARLIKPATLKESEKRSIIEALHRWEGNRTRTAAELGITRRTLWNKIKEYGLDV